MLKNGIVRKAIDFHKKNVDELLKKLVFLPKTQTFLFLNLYNLNLIVQNFDISDVD